MSFPQLMRNGNTWISYKREPSNITVTLKEIEDIMYLVEDDPVTSSRRISTQSSLRVKFTKYGSRIESINRRKVNV